MVSHRKRHQIIPTSWWIIFIYFLEYWLKSVLFRYRVNSMQNLARSTNWDSAIDRSIAIDLLATPALVHETEDCSILTYILVIIKLLYNRKHLLNYIIQRTSVERRLKTIALSFDQVHIKHDQPQDLSPNSSGVSREWQALLVPWAPRWPGLKYRLAQS